MKKTTFLCALLWLAASCTQNTNPDKVSATETNTTSSFTGSVSLDIRDSKPDWNSFLYKKAPKDAPNVLVILYDDTGQATWSPYGGMVNMPTLERLAKNGLTYTQWH